MVRCTQVWPGVLRCVLLLSTVDQLIFVGAFEAGLDTIIIPQLLSMLKELLQGETKSQVSKTHL